MFLKPISITSSTYTIRTYQDGVTFLLNRAAGIAITLPSPKAGMTFNVLVATSPTGNCTISTAGGSDVMVVSVNELETDTTEDGPYDDNADVITLVANVSLKGDFLSFRCDGTYWYVVGQVAADGALTTSTT